MMRYMRENHLASKSVHAEVHAYEINAVDLPGLAIACGGVPRRGGGIKPDRNF